MRHLLLTISLLSGGAVFAADAASAAVDEPAVEANDPDQAKVEALPQPGKVTLKSGEILRGDVIAQDDKQITILVSSEDGARLDPAEKRVIERTDIRTVLVGKQLRACKSPVVKGKPAARPVAERDAPDPDDLAKKRERLEKYRDSRKERLAKYESRMSELEGELAKVEGEISKKKDRLKAVETQIKAEEKKSSGRRNNNNGKKNNNKKRNNKAYSHLIKLTKERNTLRHAVPRLEGELTSVKGSIKSLARSISSTKGQIEKYEKELSELGG